MKEKLIIVTIFILYCCEVPETYHWEKDISFQNVLSKSSGQIILLDFETEWCGWCKKLDQNTYTDTDVINFANKHIISMKVDAEKGAGIELAKKYNVTGYPTIVFINNNGEEIDRIVGYKDPIPFLKELKRIQTGKNTLPTLLTEFQTDPKNFSTLFKLTKKYEAMGDIISAKKMIDIILDLNVDSANTGQFFEILYNARDNQDPIELIEYIHNNSDGNYLTVAIQEAMYLVRKDGTNSLLEAELYFKLINSLEKVSPPILNSYAWRMSELGLNLDIALEKVNIAIEEVKDDNQKYMFIDTKAEILWKLDRIQESIVEIKKCISFEPNNEYYKEQLEKFQKSLKHT